ncbi:hypothetical protein SAMN02745220_05353 [Desulfopila aestuarii DSM 18488]|uniref:Uncharacterized protein n=1 Tax=Desulfopila aestuarii DSM 18488 TaxID=1121416 RepID=A0A1M7YMT6_9BACT|nr:hypothetical protein SAMN02745220_05353 [Desulfopila aestuarii DSM 18488]
MDSILFQLDNSTRNITLVISSLQLLHYGAIIGRWPIPTYQDIFSTVLAENHFRWAAEIFNASHYNLGIQTSVWIFHFNSLKL